MEKTPLLRLDLRAPLFYAKIAGLPPETPIFAGTAADGSSLPKNEEFLLCYELNPAQSRNIEPEKELLLGPLVFAGRGTGGSDSPQEEAVSLPAGNYLFVQNRGENGHCAPSEWLDMAVEQQKDGLWERNKPGSRLYVRFLFEDGRFVTQLFRPLE